MSTASKRIATSYDDLTYQVTGFPIGLLINYGERSLRYQRILPPRDISKRWVDRQWLYVPDWLKPEQESGPG